MVGGLDTLTLGSDGRLFSVNREGFARSLALLLLFDCLLYSSCTISLTRITASQDDSKSCLATNLLLFSSLEQLDYVPKLFNVLTTMTILLFHERSDYMQCKAMLKLYALNDDAYA